MIDENPERAEAFLTLTEILGRDIIEQLAAHITQNAVANDFNPHALMLAICEDLLSTAGRVAVKSSTLPVEHICTYAETFYHRFHETLHDAADEKDQALSQGQNPLSPSAGKGNLH
jgi:hypothetical protein